MATVFVGATKQWIGLAGDAKPTPGSNSPDGSGVVLVAADVPAGSTFYEVDSRTTYTFDGAAWRAGLTATQSAAVTTATTLDDLLASNRLVLRELRLMRQGQMKASTCAEYDGPPEELDEPV